MALSDWIELGVLVVGILAIIWGVVSYKKQMNAQLFLDFTKRFDEIMDSFPENGWSARLGSEDAPPEPSKPLTNAVLKYLNLCSEEFYLVEEGMLQKNVWKIWEGELVRTLRTPLFRREWQTLKNEFIAYQKFYQYVENIQK